MSPSNDERAGSKQRPTKDAFEDGSWHGAGHCLGKFEIWLNLSLCLLTTVQPSGSVAAFNCLGLSPKVEDGPL